MKVKSYIDPWGGIILEVAGESCHEDTVLRLLAGKRMAEHTVSTVGDSSCGSNLELRFVFRAHDQPKATGTSVVGHVTRGDVTNCINGDHSQCELG